MALDRFRVFLILLLGISDVYVPLSQAQLMGAVTAAMDPDIITVKITNIGSTKVPVLRDNNLFDFHGLSMPFSISDESGQKVPIAWTHSKAIVDEYLDLGPGETFQREFNLTDYMPVDLVMSVNITIGLPEKLPVLHPHSNLVNIDEGTDASSVNRQSVLASSSYLYTTLQSEPLDLTWTPRANQPYIEKRQVQRGISILQGTCTGNLFSIVTAIQDATSLAGAGLNASASFGDVPYSYFFSSDVTTATITAGIYQRVIEAKQGILGSIHCACQDLGNFCNTDDTHGPNSFRPGYSANIPATSRSHQLPLIVICPRSFIILKHIPVPCSDTPNTPGAQSLGNVMLHELVHINSINGGLPMTDLVGVSNAWGINNAMKLGENTTLDVSAYAHMASFAWDMGLGGAPWTGEKCLQNWTRGNFYGQF